jgi:hypothetical protein
MLFKILDGHDSDVLGGAVSEENVFISMYGVLIEGKKPVDLAVGESCRMRYHQALSQPTVYKVLRVE